MDDLEPVRTDSKRRRDNCSSLVAIGTLRSVPIADPLTSVSSVPIAPALLAQASAVDPDSLPPGLVAVVIGAAIAFLAPIVVALIVFDERSARSTDRSPNDSAERSRGDRQ